MDPTGFTAEGAEFQGVLRETKDYLIDQAQGEGAVGWLKGVTFGFLAGAVGIVEAGVGLVDEGATVAYTVPGVDVMGDPTGVQSREEIKKQVSDLKQTYHTLKEEGFGNALGRLAKGATNTVIAAAKGDPRAIAQVTSVVTEIAGPGAALKGSGALRAVRKGTGELVRGAGRTIRRTYDDAARGLREGAESFSRQGELAQARAIVAGRRGELGSAGRIPSDAEARRIVAAAEEGGTTGPARSALGVDASYPDPAPTVYRNRLRPDSPVVDHVRARALRGHPTDPQNQYIRAWSENSRKEIRRKLADFRGALRAIPGWGR